VLDLSGTGVAEKLVGRAILDHFAHIHESHAAGDATRKSHFVSDHHHGHAVGCERRHDVENFIDHFRIERRRRLVEQHNLGI
jgi:hypothetical protein